MIKPSYAPKDVQLMISHLSYRPKTLDLTNNAWKYEIILEESAVVLESVEIKSRPTEAVRGDTIDYNVERFARDGDRSIGEVFSRISYMRAILTLNWINTPTSRH